MNLLKNNDPVTNVMYREQFTGFLNNAAEHNWNWAAFDRSHAEKPFYGFISAGEAEDFCTAANNEFNYFEQDFLDADYVFLPLANLIVQHEYRASISTAELEKIGRQLNGQDLQLLPGWKMGDVIPYLELELYFPLQWQHIFNH